MFCFVRSSLWEATDHVRQGNERAADLSTAQIKHILLTEMRRRWVSVERQLLSYLSELSLVTSWTNTPLSVGQCLAKLCSLFL